MESLVSGKTARRIGRIGLTIASVVILLAALWSNGATATRSPLPVASAERSGLVAQRLSTTETWQQVYQQVPDFPLENQYVNRDTGEVAESSTLASRMLYYHTYVKGRPPNYRLDWKLTLADYLGANERMVSANYPGAETLRTNPMQGDIQAIATLNRAQREQLVDVLVSLFAPVETIRPEAIPSPADRPTPSPPAASPSPNSGNSGGSLYPRSPQPGDAQLLQP